MWRSRKLPGTFASISRKSCQGMVKLRYCSPSSLRTYLRADKSVSPTIARGCSERPSSKGRIPIFWQAAAQGKSSIAQTGMLYAAKIMALTAIDFLLKPELVNKAREELTETLNGETYPDPLPKDLKPELW